jgi:hypothetical protein
MPSTNLWWNIYSHLSHFLNGLWIVLLALNLKRCFKIIYSRDKSSVKYIFSLKSGLLLHSLNKFCHRVKVFDLDETQLF